jgi:uncharacterized protein with HEPN domain
MSERNTGIYLADIAASCKKISKYTGGFDEKSFVADEKTFDAVIRNFEIIGEAANKMDKKIKEKYPGIPWRDMVDFRNRISHEYFGLSTEIVWKIIKDELPELEKKIKEIQSNEK